MHKVVVIPINGKKLFIIVTPGQDQCIKNCFALVVADARHRDLVKPVLIELNWLPILARISYNIATLIHRVRTSRQPSHMADCSGPHQAIQSGNDTLFLIGDSARKSVNEDFN